MTKGRKQSANPTGGFRDRIKELRRVRAGDLIPRQAIHLHFERTADPDERTIRLVYPD